ncbi:hypothetical protein DFH29DRAFT_819367 [Suillus ampliporus]|nr:hypothetical protein DFH29DRAFT_819367 [Suillus ampliporus]
MFPPPGEEGFSFSHGAEEVSLYADLEQITTERSRRLDLRDHGGRVAQQLADWSTQYDNLTDALLHCLSISYISCSLDRSTRTFNHALPFINATLLQYGCIGSSPLHPTVAITIRTLDVFCQTHCVCLHYSINAEGKKLAFLHNVIAYDIYLELEQCIENHLQTALGHFMIHRVNWCMLNSCPACQYKVVGEPPLKYSVLCALDSNNSVKLIDTAIRSGNERFDPRCSLSSIWLTETYVDQFKDEVQHVHHMQNQCVSCDPDDPWVDEPDSGDSLELSTVCVDHWRNAAPESHKKMFTIFKRSGIFIAVCQHGFLLTICDMV